MRRLLLLSFVLLPILAGCTSGESASSTTDSLATSVSSTTTTITAKSTTTAAVAPTTGTSTSLPAIDEIKCEVPEPDIGPRPDIDSSVSIALYCGDESELRLVDRVVAASDDPVKATVEKLLLGVTPHEAQVGMVSMFSRYTAGQFNSAQIDSTGMVTIDLALAFIRTNNFSTSGGGMAVFEQLSKSLFAVPAVSGIELSVDGERWCGWETGPCDQFPTPLIARKS